MSNKTNTDDVDEEFFLATFRDDNVSIPEKKESKESNNAKNKPKERKQKKVVAAADDKLLGCYKENFFKQNEFKNRSSVYISQYSHQMISKIIQILGSRSMSLGGYIDLIVKEHLATHKEVLMDAFRKWKEEQITDFDDII